MSLIQNFCLRFSPVEANVPQIDPQQPGSSRRPSVGSRVGEAAGEDPRPKELDCRAGGRVLTIFTTPLNCLVVRALANGPMRLTDLRKEVGGPPQTTLRGHLGNLIGIGALEKRSVDGRPNTVENALTPMGLELVHLSDVLEAWLRRAPESPLPLESEPGKAAIKALISGWDSTMLRALAARPFSLTELDNLITAYTYPALERRLSALHFAGHVAPVPSKDKGTPYAVTEWLRQGVAPLLVAIRCEARHLAGETAPLARIDVEALLLLAIPLISLPGGATGSCQLVVENEEARWRTAGAVVSVERGKVVGCSSKLEPAHRMSIRGAAGDWLDALIDGDGGRLTVDGDGELARQVVGALSSALFSS